MFRTFREKKLINKAIEFDQQKKYSQSFPLYLEAAKMGNALAQNNVGYAYLYGEGTDKNYKEALSWLEKAAAQNFAAAINALGFCYSSGFGVAQDKHKALEYYEKAASLGNKTALKNIESVKEQLKKQAPTKSADELIKEALELDRQKKFEQSFQLYLEAAKMGNALFYGEYEIIGNVPIAEEVDYPVMYGNSIHMGEKAVCYQCGKTFRKIDNVTELYPNFRNNGVSYNLNFTLDILLQCIRENSNTPYWENYYTHWVDRDLRNPKHTDKLEKVKEQFGL